MRRVSRLSVAGAVVALALAASCSSESDTAAPSPAPTEKLAERKDMLDANFCNPCHHDHFTEWQGSMHAYATDDPLFRALNAKMQAESPPEQQGFCLRCHAPMAIRLGVPLDFASLDARPELKGVNCIFCHSVENVGGSNNNPLQTHEGHEMFGAIRDAMDPGVHKTQYSALTDATSDGSSGLCGPCHDIVTVKGAHIERTFREWATSRFGVGQQTKTSCGVCHMPTRQGPAAGVPKAPIRTLHDHSLAGVDLALTPFPGKDAQRTLVQRFLDDAISTKICVSADGAGAIVDVAVRNEKVGHAWPSGSTQDRRAWLELVASKDGAPIYTSGSIPDGVSVASAADPDIFLLRDHDLDSEGNETELFWRAASFTSKQLPASTSADPASDAYAPTMHATYRMTSMPDQVRVVMKLRPVDFDFLAAAEIDLATLDPIPTFRLAGTDKLWNASDGPCSP